LGEALGRVWSDGDKRLCVEPRSGATSGATSGARSRLRASSAPLWRPVLVGLEGAANGVCLDGGLELRAGVVDERLVDVDALEAEPAGGVVGEAAFECAGVEADRQADLVGSVLEARLAGAVSVEGSQLAFR
jgi:hypothetical protein